jgi:hypothetical protein
MYRLSVCSATDNTSSNGPLNDTIARKCAEITLEATNARNMQIGCGGHVTNIVAQYSVSSIPPLIAPS